MYQRVMELAAPARRSPWMFAAVAEVTTAEVYYQCGGAQVIIAVRQRSAHTRVNNLTDKPIAYVQCHTARDIYVRLSRLDLMGSRAGTRLLTESAGAPCNPC